MKPSLPADLKTLAKTNVIQFPTPKPKPKQETFYEALVRVAYEPDHVWIERLRRVYGGK